MSLVTDEMLARVGVSGGRRAAAHPISPEDVRRFAQAVMDPDPTFWDEVAAQHRGFPGVVTPPLYPFHAFRPEASEPDRLDALLVDPDWDGLGQIDFFGVSLPDVGLPRTLNGGTEAEFFQLAGVNDTVSAEARLLSIEEKSGRSGPMVVTRISVEFSNQLGEPLATVITTMLQR